MPILKQISSSGRTTKTSISQKIESGANTLGAPPILSSIAGAATDVGLNKVSQVISQNVGTAIDLDNITFGSLARSGLNVIENKLTSNNTVAGKILNAAINRAGGLEAIVFGKNSKKNQPLIAGFDKPLDFDFYLIPEYEGMEVSNYFDANAAKNTNLGKINFYFEPENFSDSVQANFTSESIMGRSSEILGYSGTSNRQVSFSVVLHDDYPKGELLSTVRRLQALQYPLYLNSTTKPPSCFLKIGNIVEGRFICLATNVTWRKPMRVVDGIARYVIAEVSLAFKQINAVPQSADEIGYTSLSNPQSFPSFADLYKQGNFTPKVNVPSFKYKL